VSDQNETQTSTPAEGQEPDAPAVEETPNEETPAAEEETPTPTPEDDLPDWARKELTKVRGEAANYRTRLRDAETKLAEAKTPEEVAAAVADLQTKNAELERNLLVTSVAMKHKLPDDLAALLQGDNEEALTKHAKVLAKYAPAEEDSDPESLSGGLTPGDGQEFDPVATAREARKRRY
jgi:hypothetical protein